MKILLYNIAYGTGCPGSEYRRLLTGHRYLFAPVRPMRQIGQFLEEEEPDAICLVETDLGSRRSRRSNQVVTLAERLGYHSFFQPKYAPESLLRRMPYLRYQGNAILTRQTQEIQEVAFLPKGMKRLVIMTRVGAVNLVLVHLALTRRTREFQLGALAELLPAREPLIVAGDFNTFAGRTELNDFLRRTGLHSANEENLPTYPAWAPVRQLDYLLLSPELRVTGFQVPQLPFSDHLPVIADISEAPRGQVV